MTRFSLIRLVTILLLTVLPTAWADGTVSERAAREIIVKWRVLPSRLDAAQLLPELASDVEEFYFALPACGRTDGDLERITVLRLRDVGRVAECVAQVARDPRVEYAEPRPIRDVDAQIFQRQGRGRSLDGRPDDPFYPQQWGLHTIEAEAAWDVTRGDPAVAIAVVDVGVDFLHPELAPARWENNAELDGVAGVDDDGNGYVDDVYGYDFVDNDGDPLPNPREPSQSHGTHVAGVIAAARNNGVGIAGIAPACKLMGVRAGDGRIPYGYEGIYYACQAGARVINCSWGGESESAYERDVLHYVLGRGCVVVVSAGNDNSSAPHYPAAIEGALSVAATQIGDWAAGFTQYGPWVKISSPGVAIISTMTEEQGQPAYATWQGTSMAAPLVAGVCGLVASRYPQMDGRSIMARVMSSADPIDRLNPSKAGLLGLGRVNAWRALVDSVAGLRLGEISYEEQNGNGDGRIRGGESARLRISVYNDVAPLEGGHLLMATSEDSVGISPNLAAYDDLPVGGPFWNASPIVIELASGIGRGSVLPLTLDFLGGDNRLIGRATAVVHLDSTFAVLDNGYLRLGYGEHGSLGFHDYQRQLYSGPGLAMGEYANALYHGSFLVAADGAVSDNAYGDAALTRMDWVTVPDSVAHHVPSQRADIEVHASFEDRQAEQILFARVDAAGLAWTDNDARRLLVLEYAVTNRSLNPWNEAYFGFFLDWDLGGPSTNVSGFDTVSGAAYVMQEPSFLPMAGVVALTEPFHTFYVVDNRAEIDPPADWSDARKWEIIRSGMGSPNMQPKDVSHIVGLGPFTVPAHSVRTVAFAFIVGSSLDELRAQAQLARQRYSPPGGPASGRMPTARSIDVYPNPIRADQQLHVRIPSLSEVEVSIFNLLGQRVTFWKGKPGRAGEVLLDPARLSVANGLLFYQIRVEAKVYTGKILRFQ